MKKKMAILLVMVLLFSVALSGCKKEGEVELTMENYKYYLDIDQSDCLYNSGVEVDSLYDFFNFNMVSPPIEEQLEELRKADVSIGCSFCINPTKEKFSFKDVCVKGQLIIEHFRDDSDPYKKTVKICLPDDIDEWEEIIVPWNKQMKVIIKNLTSEGKSKYAIEDALEAVGPDVYWDVHLEITDISGTVYKKELY